MNAKGFRKLLQSLINDNRQIYSKNGMPFEIGTYFSSLFDCGYISDYELQVYYRLDNEIILTIKTNEKNYLKTNAFIFNNNVMHYFDSKWEVIIGPGKYNLGKILEHHLTDNG